MRDDRDERDQRRRDLNSARRGLCRSFEEAITAVEGEHNKMQMAYQKLSLDQEAHDSAKADFDALRDAENALKVMREAAKELRSRVYK